MTVVIGNQQAYEIAKQKAIKSADELVVGETYWSNSYPKKFKVFELLTAREFDRRRGFGISDYTQPEGFRWMLVEYEDGCSRPTLSECSLMDRNCIPGTSYNPWHIFKTEDDARAMDAAEISVVCDETDYDEYYCDYEDFGFVDTHDNSDSKEYDDE